MFKVSSYQSMGACDGPSLRTVVFLYGCPLRCAYCHNPETWTGEDFTLMTVEQLAKKIIRNKTYFKDGGGVTISGGEPLLHQKQLISLFEKMKEEGIHTCLDTSGSEKVTSELLDLTDLFLVDVKFLSGEEYQAHIKRDIFDSMVDLLEQTKENNKAIWIRHVLYPGLTDNKEYVTRLLDFLAPYTQIQRVDLLPFKSICTTKYERLGIPFPMADVKASPAAVISEVKALVPEKWRG